MASSLGAVPTAAFARTHGCFLDGDGYWWWQSTEAKAARWVVPQWEVLAADRGGWRAGLKGLRVNESEVDVC
jgi:hypothetical protein